MALIIMSLASEVHVSDAYSRLTAKNRDQLRNPTLEYGLPFYPVDRRYRSIAAGLLLSALSAGDISG